jgi:hypothetical protein
MNIIFGCPFGTTEDILQKLHSAPSFLKTKKKKKRENWTESNETIILG